MGMAVDITEVVEQEFVCARRGHLYRASFKQFRSGKWTVAFLSPELGFLRGAKLDEIPKLLKHRRFDYLWRNDTDRVKRVTQHRA